MATGFGYDAGVRAAQAEVVARLLPRVRDIRRLGSAALDLAWPAAGRYDAYYEYGVNAWDWAAGEMLCSAAGLETRHLEALPGTGRRPARRGARASSTSWRRSSPDDGAGAQADGAQARGVARRVAQRQLLAAAQPRVQAVGVAGQLDPRDAARVAARAGIGDARDRAG